MDIEQLLLQPESKTLEFKRDISSLEPILKTIVAFANTAGGTLIIGRAAEGGIVGVKDIFKAEEALVVLNKNSCGNFYVKAAEIADRKFMRIA